MGQHSALLTNTEDIQNPAAKGNFAQAGQTADREILLCASELP